MDAPHLDDRCDEGEHDIVWDADRKMRVCDKYDLTEQTIVDSIGHNLTTETSE